MEMSNHYVLEWVGEQKLIGPKIVQQIEDKVKMIKDRLNSLQKSKSRTLIFKGVTLSVKLEIKYS